MNISIRTTRGQTHPSSQLLPKVTRSKDDSVLLRRFPGPHVFVKITKEQLSNGQPSRWVVMNFSGLKYINDHYPEGHKAGDSYLNAIGTKLEELSEKFRITNPIIVRDGPNFAINIPQGVNASKFMAAVVETFKDGVNFPHGPAYTPATEGRSSIMNIGILTFDRSLCVFPHQKIKIKEEGIYRALREEIYYLNRRETTESPRHNTNYIIDPEKAVILNSYSLEDRLVNFSENRIPGNLEADLFESRSGLPNVEKLKIDAAKLLEGDKNVLFAAVDGNAFGSFRSLGFIGELMMDAIVEKRFKEAAQVLPEGVTLYRHGPGSEEFYLLADETKISKEVFKKSIANFMETLNKPLLIKIEREMLEKTELGKKFLLQNPQLQTDVIKLDNGKTIDVVLIDITSIERFSYSDGRTHRGISITASMGTINQNLVEEGFKIREIKEGETFIDALFREASQAITEKGESSKKVNPERKNVLIEVEFQKGEAVGIFVELPPEIADPKLALELREAGEKFKNNLASWLNSEKSLGFRSSPRYQRFIKTIATGANIGISILSFLTIEEILDIVGIENKATRFSLVIGGSHVINSATSPLVQMSLTSAGRQQLAKIITNPKSHFVQGIQGWSQTNWLKGVGGMFSGIGYAFLASTIYNKILDGSGVSPDSWLRSSLPQFAVGMGAPSLFGWAGGKALTALGGKALTSTASRATAGLAIASLVSNLPSIMLDDYELYVYQRVREEVQVNRVRQGGLAAVTAFVSEMFDLGTLMEVATAKDNPELVKKFAKEDAQQIAWFKSQLLDILKKYWLQNDLFSYDGRPQNLDYFENPWLPTLNLNEFINQNPEVKNLIRYLVFLKPETIDPSTTSIADNRDLREIFDSEGNLRPGKEYELIVTLLGGEASDLYPKLSNSVKEFRKAIRLQALLAGSPVTEVDKQLGLVNFDGSINTNSNYYLLLTQAISENLPSFLQ